MERMLKHHGYGCPSTSLYVIRTDEGYMAEVQLQEEGSFLLIENHCSICTAAVACTRLYRHELEVFQAVLGQNMR
jgi:predicted ArsR family transcriptional regulator